MSPFLFFRFDAVTQKVTYMLLPDYNLSLLFLTASTTKWTDVRLSSTFPIIDASVSSHLLFIFSYDKLKYADFSMRQSYIHSFFFGIIQIILDEIQYPTSIL